MKKEKPISFIASHANTGAVTLRYDRTVEVRKNGKSLTGGELKAGQSYFVNTETGELENIP